LYHAVAEHLATFLAGRQLHGRPVPFQEELPDGRLLYHLKRRWHDGTDRVVFEPLEFLERLAALVPAPHFNMIPLKRVFAVDALKCDGCGGRMRILCAVNPPDAIRKILDWLGMPIRAPPTAPALIEDWGGDDINDAPVYSESYA
jgi:hypothetical protein